MVVFQDLRDDPSQPVQMLVDHHQTSIIDIDHDESAFITQHDVPWQHDKPIRSGTHSTKIIHAEENKVWLNQLKILKWVILWSKKTT